MANKSLDTLHHVGHHRLLSVKGTELLVIIPSRGDVSSLATVGGHRDPGPFSYDQRRTLVRQMVEEGSVRLSPDTKQY